RAGRALAIARELGDPALLARTLTACGIIAGTGYDAHAARNYFSEAMVFALNLDDRWSLSQILTFQSGTAVSTGDPVAARAAGEEGHDLADAIGDRPNSRMCRSFIGYVRLMEGDVVGAVAEFRDVIAVCEAEHDELVEATACMGLAIALAH